MPVAELFASMAILLNRMHHKAIRCVGLVAYVEKDRKTGQHPDDLAALKQEIDLLVDDIEALMNVTVREEERASKQVQ